MECKKVYLKDVSMEDSREVFLRSMPKNPALEMVDQEDEEAEKQDEEAEKQDEREYCILFLFLFKIFLLIFCLIKNLTTYAS